jgi:hypothetical protein
MTLSQMMMNIGLRYIPTILTIPACYMPLTGERRCARMTGSGGGTAEKKIATETGCPCLESLMKLMSQKRCCGGFGTVLFFI